MFFANDRQLFSKDFLQMWYGQRKSLKSPRRWKPILYTFFVMTRNAKIAAEGTFEPCRWFKGQRSLSIWSNISSLNMHTIKISKCKKQLFVKKASIRRWVMWRSIKLVCENLPKIIILTECLTSIGSKSQ